MSWILVLRWNLETANVISSYNFGRSWTLKMRLLCLILVLSDIPSSIWGALIIFLNYSESGAFPVNSEFLARILSAYWKCIPHLPAGARNVMSYLHECKAYNSFGIRIHIRFIKNLYILIEMHNRSCHVLEQIHALLSIAWNTTS